MEDETHINGDEGGEDDEGEDDEEEEKEANQYHSEEIYPIMTLAQLLIFRHKLTVGFSDETVTRKYFSKVSACLVSSCSSYEILAS